MRIPFPERFQWKYVWLFIATLFVVELACGTSLYFAALVAVYIVVWAFAFNLAGGMSYPSGSYIFFAGVLILLLGLVYKCFLGEPADSHLVAPLTTMLVNIASVGGMAVAVFASKRLMPKHPFLSRMNSHETMMQAAIGSLIVGFGLLIVLTASQVQAGTVGSAIAQINHLPEFAVMLATTYEIRQSGGKRAYNWVVIVGVLAIFAFGVIYTSKEGMFLGPVTWLITAVANRFDFKAKEIIVGSIGAWFLIYYMVPYSQYVREFRDKDGRRSANQAIALEYIFKLNEVRELYLDVEEDDNYTQMPHFFNKSQGLMDRLCMIQTDDALIDHTDQGFVLGLFPTYAALANTVPKFIWPGKPFFYSGNEYGRELQIISPDDVTTGIAFGAEADMYHQAQWFGMLFVFPVILFAFFYCTDAFAGSVRDSPWPLLLIVLNSHLAPEGMVTGLALQIVEGSFGLLAMSAIVRYVFPLVLRVMTGGEKTVVRQTVQFRSRRELAGPRPELVEPKASS